MTDLTFVITKIKTLTNKCVTGDPKRESSKMLSRGTIKVVHY